MGKIQRSMSADGSVRVCLIDSTDVVNEAFRIFKTSPVVTAALGRTLTGALLMSSFMDKGNGKVNLVFSGDGPLGNVRAIADGKGNVKGYPAKSIVDLPLNDKGKLDVGKAIGKGLLTVIREDENGKMFTGTSEIVTGEIAEDITNYFYTSEQIPSACALGVLVNTDYTCKAAGGFLLQIMPNATEATVNQIEENVKTMQPISTLLANGSSLDTILSMIFGGFFYKVLSEDEVSYYCDCSQERVLGALNLLKQDEIDDLADENGMVEVTCRFCDKVYTYKIDELKKLLSEYK